MRFQAWGVEFKDASRAGRDSAGTVSTLRSTHVPGRSAIQFAPSALPASGVTVADVSASKMPVNRP